MAESKRQFWSDHIEQWSNSGLSKVKYCREQQLDVKSFYNWFSQLKKERLPQEPTAFTQFTLPAPERSSIRIQLGTLAIDWDSQTDPTPLVALLRQLGVGS